ncbi:hypothetical protein LTR85_010103 [Meristemomyces frigidus]|nr:hypothetical protein LTR85_010103 [Meristemomyces frigidus]
MAPKTYHDSNESSSSSLPAIVAVIALVYNLLFAIVCSYLPDDPLYLGQSVSVYAWAGCALSLIGFIGIVTKQATLVASFSHYLLMDACVSALCRVFALQYFVDTFSEENVCDDGYATGWRDDRLSHDVITSPHWQKQTPRSLHDARRCYVALGAVQFILIVLLMALTAVQWSLAVAMRRYGKEMEKAKEQTEGPASPDRLGMETMWEKV